jgi:PAS domain S-box-containing protein
VPTCHAYSEQILTSLPQQLIRALGRLQAQTPTPALGSVYIYDLLKQCTINASYPVAAMLGYSADAIHVIGYIGLTNLIHPEDLNSVSQHYERFSTLSSEDVIRIDYRMRKADGSWCLLRSQETPLILGEDGLPIQILGMIQNITRRRRSVPAKTPLNLAKVPMLEDEDDVQSRSSQG